MTKTQVAEILWGWRPGPRRRQARRSPTPVAGRGPVHGGAAVDLAIQLQRELPLGGPAARPEEASHA
jgi:hypothetical protein